ncbi:MAG: hypothetical protein CK425_00010 [Parachlamydia sp.]|nr:MAG: hypothetical protein CK425_00010 [Parachlamydia sp.]
MAINIKNITTQSQFHECVIELKNISDANDQHLTTKLQGKKGNLEGRLVTFLKKILSLLPGVHIARTNPLEVAKAIEKFATDYHKKKILIGTDRDILTSVVRKLKIKDPQHAHAIDSVENRIRRLPTRLNQIYNKSSPLIQAIIDKDKKKFKELLTPQEINRRNDEGSLPLHFAVQFGDLEMVKLLLPKTTEGINCRGDSGSTCLHFAIAAKVEVVKYLLDNKADANIPDYSGNLPLHRAAQAGDLGVVKLLLSKTTEGINCKGELNATPLHFAAFEGKVDVIRYLLDNKADANIPDDSGNLPLHHAAQGRDLEKVKLLLPKTTAGIHCKGFNGNTPLFFAAIAGKANIVKYLLNNKADANIPNDKKMLPLHLAAQAGDLEMVKLLLPKTKDGINVKWDKNLTPLFCAAQAGKINVVKYLLENKADANISNNEKSLPLHFAAQAGDLEMFKLLLPKTKDGINCKGELDSTPLLFAAMAGKVNVVKYLLENKADANIPNVSKSLPLHFGAQAGELEIVRRLLPVTANGINALGDQGATPLFFALLSGEVNLVQYLLDNKADANISDDTGNLPLHYAAHTGCTDCIKLLFSNTTTGINVLGEGKMTPLSIAVKNGHADAVKWLLENGADETIPDVDGNLPINNTSNPLIIDLLTPKK